MKLADLGQPQTEENENGRKEFNFTKLPTWGNWGLSSAGAGSPPDENACTSISNLIISFPSKMNFLLSGIFVKQWVFVFCHISQAGIRDASGYFAKLCVCVFFFVWCVMNFNLDCSGRRVIQTNIHKRYVAWLEHWRSPTLQLTWSEKNCSARKFILLTLPFCKVLEKRYYWKLSFIKHCSLLICLPIREWRDSI